jgi:chorismate synthase
MSMANLKFLTAGESHGRALLGILEGIPSGFAVSSGDINADLRRRQGGHGRGGRMKIESDMAEILSGIRHGRTLGSPIGIMIENKDWDNWKEAMSTEHPVLGAGAKKSRVTRPRPGHADLAGALKYDHADIRNVLERSSARETAMRVALGVVAKMMLVEFDIVIGSYVTQIGNVKVQSSKPSTRAQAEVLRVQSSEKELLKMFGKAERSLVRCPDAPASKKMVALIDRAVRNGDSLGGVFEVFATGVPAGLGSHVHWDRKLDGRLAQAVMSVQAIKGVEIGSGFGMGGKFGSEVMDEIYYRAKGKGQKAESMKSGLKAQGAKSLKLGTRHSGLSTFGFYRKTNFAGGIEGGMSNGMPIVVRGVMKPIPTLRKPLRSVDIRSKRAYRAAYERSDTCAVPAAAVVAEAMAALVVADAFLEKFGGDSRKEVMRNYKSYISYLAKF